MMVLPLPPLLLDLLLALNISLAILVLLLTMNIQGALQFSIFPSLLLITTLFRLALNVSTTRLILIRDMRARSSSHLATSSSAATTSSVVVFLILVVIQFIVITKGAERVAEVAARFTLDAMPGKQMSIDADLNAGLIDEKEARKRAERDREGSRLLRGDGRRLQVCERRRHRRHHHHGDQHPRRLCLGIGQKGSAFGEALQQYTLLTVGDGLVTQIPALLISTATGIIITRAPLKRTWGRTFPDNSCPNLRCSRPRPPSYSSLDLSRATLCAVFRACGGPRCDGTITTGAQSKGQAEAQQEPNGGRGGPRSRRKSRAYSKWNGRTRDRIGFILSSTQSMEAICSTASR